METIWIEENQLERAKLRNEAFWRGELEETPLMWVTVPGANPVPVPPEPATDEELWTDVDYVIEAAESMLARTAYFGDALPVYNPWLGPDQFAGWLGADLVLKPREFTSWVVPFVEDWNDYPQWRIDPDNQWWKLYLEIVRRSIDAGQGKWITAYPDLHSGIDALSALRGPENLIMDMMTRPDGVKRAMDQMTDLFKWVVDEVSGIVLPAGQGTSNWTMGWSEKRFVCIGQNDFTCMISPQMFDEFCWHDNEQTCNHVDYSLYHLDGPGAARNHLDRILQLENLNTVQWVQGAGNPTPANWLDLLKKIRAAGKSVQVMYHGGITTAQLLDEIEILCRELDPTRLFFWIMASSTQEAQAALDCARRTCAGS